MMASAACIRTIHATKPWITSMKASLLTMQMAGVSKLNLTMVRSMASSVSSSEGRRSKHSTPEKHLSSSRRPVLTNKFSYITDEIHQAARKQVVDEYKKRRLDFNDDWNVGTTPDLYQLQDIDQYVKGAAEMKVSRNTTDEEDLMASLPGRGIVTQVVNVDRVQKVISQGKTLSFRALVVAGNKKGAGGYGIGKADNVQDAVVRGTREALKNFIHVDRFDDRTLYHEVKGKFNSCKLFIKPTATGRGLTVSDTVGAVLYVLGIDDVVSKCHGQRNPFTVVKATFNALHHHESAEEVAMKTGRTVVEINRMRKAHVR